MPCLPRVVSLLIAWAVVLGAQESGLIAPPADDDGVIALGRATVTLPEGIEGNLLQFLALGSDSSAAQFTPSTEDTAASPGWHIEVLSLPGHPKETTLPDEADLLRHLRYQYHARDLFDQRAGFSAKVVGWKPAPTYNSVTHVLRWGVELDRQGVRYLDHHVVQIGASGVLMWSCEVEQSKTVAAQSAMDQLIKATSWSAGEEFTAHKPDQHLRREGGLARLILHPDPDEDQHLDSAGRRSMDAIGILLLLGAAVCLGLSARPVRTALDEYVNRCRSCQKPVQPLDLRCGSCGASLVK